MTLIRHFLLGTALAIATATSFAQAVKGNESVKTLADGSKQVEAPPLPKGTLGKPCPATQAGCAGGGWLMVETKDGLSECTELYARPGTCRPSTYGNEKRWRIWIVKIKGEWMQCQFPDLASKCVSTKSLPTSAVQ